MGSRRERARSARGLQGPCPVQQHQPSHMFLADSSVAQPSRALAAVCSLLSGPASFHLPAHPSLHDHYSFHRYYGCSDFVLGSSSASERHEHRCSQADLPDSCVWSSGHSVSNHLRNVRRWRGIAPDRAPDARGFYPPRQASHSARRLAHSRRPNRVHFVHLPGGRRYGLPFSFHCSPPRVATTQLWFDTARLFTAQKRTFTASTKHHLRRTSADAHIRQTQLSIQSSRGCGHPRSNKLHGRELKCRHFLLWLKALL